MSHRLLTYSATGPSAAAIHGRKGSKEVCHPDSLVHDGSHRPLGSNATHPRSSEKGIFHPPRTQPRVANAHTHEMGTRAHRKACGLSSFGPRDLRDHDSSHDQPKGAICSK